MIRTLLACALLCAVSSASGFAVHHLDNREDEHAVEAGPMLLAGRSARRMPRSMLQDEPAMSAAMRAKIARLQAKNEVAKEKSVQVPAHAERATKEIGQVTQSFS